MKKCKLLLDWIGKLVMPIVAISLFSGALYATTCTQTSETTGDVNECLSKQGVGCNHTPQWVSGSQAGDGCGTCDSGLESCKYENSTGGSQPTGYTYSGC